MDFIRTSSRLLSLLGGTAILSGTAQPTVVLDYATVIGLPNGTTVQYLGLPFAQPP